MNIIHTVHETCRQVSNTTCLQFLVQFADQYLTLSTTLPGTESIYGLGEHKVALQLKRLVAYYSSIITYSMCVLCVHVVRVCVCCVCMLCVCVLCVHGVCVCVVGQHSQVVRASIERFQI